MGNDKPSRPSIDVTQVVARPVPAMEYSPSEGYELTLIIRDQAGRRYEMSDRMSRHEADTWVEFFQDIRGLVIELQNSEGRVSALKALWHRYMREIDGKWPLV